MGKGEIIRVDLTKEMSSSYMEYSMAVIIGRAIPDLCDGLKPVQRRILTAMQGLGLKSSGPFKKSARVEGETMGKYHPHGSAYGAMVTMAAPYLNNHRLIDGHGNWGSETDPAAASRYTECRLSAFAEECLLEDKDIWETRPNYDGSLQEPVRFESAVPNVLITGGEGIGVGYATSIPQHNLREVIKATVGLLEGKTPQQLAKYLVPDFPSGTQIVKDEGLLQYLETGQGSIRQRSLSEVGKFERGGRKTDWDVITFTALPYQVSTEKVGDEIRKLLEQGKVADITDISDQSDLTGQRLLVYTKKGEGERVRDALYQYTSLDKSFAANNTVIDGLSPVRLSPYQIIAKWLCWRDERLQVKFSSEKQKAETRIHIVEGLLKALSMLDKVIAAIRKSADKVEAMTELKGKGFGFSEPQAEAILQLRLQALTGMDRDALEKEAEELVEQLKRLSQLLSSKESRDQFLKGQLQSLATRHGNKRVSPVIEVAPAASIPTPTPTAVAVAKTRYLKVNVDNGVVTQSKTPRGSNLVLTDSDKLIVLSSSGWVKRLPPRHNGPCFTQSESVPLFDKQSNLEGKKLLGVWELEGSIYASTLDGSLLCKTTSKGKRWMPEGATLLHLSQESFTLTFSSKRKKPKKLSVATVKERPVGSRGNKLCLAKDVLC